jgi:hypothetical protein
VDLLALLGSLVASGLLMAVALLLRRATRRRTWAAVPGGVRRDFFGDRVDELHAAEEPVRTAA